MVLHLKVMDTKETRVDQPTAVARNRAAVRKHRYGITQTEYEAMLAEQGNACAVCRVGLDDKNKPRIDHDRNCCPTSNTCGQCLRAILCPACTTMARYIETRFGIMEDMFRYLRLHLEARTERLTTNAQGGVT